MNTEFYKKILDNNKKWVENQLALDKDYFKDLAKGQQPPLLWIGCSDSRVPHEHYLNTIEDEEERFNKFVEVNAQEQVFDLAKTSIVQNAWRNGQELSLHGWTYGLNSGYVTDLGVNMSSNSELDEVYRLKFSI